MRPPVWFCIVALAGSLFFGLFATRVWDVQPPAVRRDEEWNKGRWWRSNARYWLAYQFWFNLVGSLTGWTALWVVAPKSWPTGVPNISWGSVALGVLAFAGVTGHLPTVFVESLLGISTVFRLVTNTIEKAMQKVV